MSMQQMDTLMGIGVLVGIIAIALGVGVTLIDTGAALIR